MGEELRASWRALAPRLAGAAAFRYACFALMCALALVHERQRGPTLHDALLERVPYVAWVDRWNWVLWLAGYLPLALWLLVRAPERWRRYMISGGLLALARGVSILLTRWGPPDPGHTGPGIGERGFARAWLELVSPWHVFAESSQRAYLTQDLFFSGHAATTLLLALYLWPWPRLRAVALVAHAAAVAAVLLAHLHYTVDVLGAWLVTGAIFLLREGHPSGPRGRA